MGGNVRGGLDGASPWGRSERGRKEEKVGRKDEDIREREVNDPRESGGFR
jgi:hypothetical protein